jgi:tetratricopeptide (TPR) repeat protein
LAVALIALPLGLAAAAAGIWFGHPAFRGRIEQALKGEEFRSRPLIWRSAILVAMEQPLTGHGASTFQWHHDRYHTWAGSAFARQAHNEYLNTWAEYGGIGLALVLATIAAGGVGFLRRWRRAATPGEAALYAGLIGACGGSLAHAVFDFNHHVFANNLVFALWAGTLAGRSVAAAGRPASAFAVRAPSAALALLGIVLFADTARSFAAHRLLDRGRAAAENMDDLRAEACFARSSRLDGSRAESFLERAKLARLRAQWSPSREVRRSAGDEAIAGYREALRRNPCLMEAEYGISLVLQQRGDNDAALAHLDGIVAFAPKDPYYQIERGILLRQMGRMKEAEAAFRAALAADPSNRVAKSNLVAVNPDASATKKKKAAGKPAP